MGTFSGQITIQFNKFPDIQRALPQQRDQALRKIAFDLKARSQQNVVAYGAVDTGALLNSHYVSPPLGLGGGDYMQAAAAVRSKRPNAVVFAEERAGQGEAVVGVAAGYGGYVHDGTAHMAGRPFMRAALESMRSAIQATMLAAIQTATGGR